MPKALVGFLLLFIIAVSHGCKNKPVTYTQQASWKITEPFSTPLSERENELSKKNLVLNSSFEDGHYYLVDSAQSFFTLKGWEKVGENVFWTDIQKESEFLSDEAFHGLHALKIIRKKSDETDGPGEGVLSDYIKVIPGKYSLSFHIKLKQVESQTPRTQRNLGDAINVRLLFFDENKMLVPGSVYDYMTGHFVDCSFKGLSFSDFTYIDELGWGKACGKTVPDAFYDGIIPENVHYVKIFLGFKGNGTIWIDKVNFEYLPDNFSFYERITGFLNTQESPSSELIPTPQNISAYSKEPLLIKANDRLIDPVILVPKGAGKEILKMAERLSVKLGTALTEPNSKHKNVRIISKTEPGMIESGRLIFNLGKTQLYYNNADFLPVKDIKGKQQAYFISTISSLKRVIFIDAVDNEGFNHACNTILQLLDSEGGFYHHHNIIDYPDIMTRALILPVQAGENFNKLIHQINELKDAGFNLIYLQLGEGLEYPSDVVKKIQEISTPLSGFLAATNDIELGISLLHIRFPKPVLKKDADILFSEGLKNYNKLVNECFKTGLSSFLITDEFIWEFMDMASKSMSYKLVDYQTFDKLFNFSDRLLSDFKAQIVKSREKKNILFLPMVSTNEDLNSTGEYSSIYFRELRKYQDILSGLLWKGPTELPGSVDFAEADFFRSKTGQRSFLFLNNLAGIGNRFSGRFAYTYPEEAGTGNIFQSMNVSIMEIPENMKLATFIIINQPAKSEISSIRVRTAADYLWNMQDYDASLSSWKALNKKYGMERSMELVRFNENLHSLLQLCLTLEQEGTAIENYKNAEAIIIDLNSGWNRITRAFSSETDLLNELSDIKNMLITRLYRIK